MPLAKPIIGKNDTPLIHFFGLAYGLSWIFWLPAIFLSRSPAMPVLYIVGGFGPSIAGFIYLARTMDKASQNDVLHRLSCFQLISGGWYAFIFLIFPVAAGLAILIYQLVYGSSPDLPALQGFSGRPAELLVLVFIAIQSLLMGPLAEEVGWRGFALDRLQSRWNSLAASLILGVVWSFWHLPLFFIPGGMYFEWGFGTGLFWLFLLRMTALSILMTGVYNHTGRSILSAILMHFAFNFTFSFLQPSPPGIHLFGTIVFIILAATLSIFSINKKETAVKIQDGVV
ncbi:MAG: CPBP family intramembrane metalloprotease [Leptolinea sp.]|nr:CPBP family intramembrane metalloprotease [Leptolinea sp.]